MMDSCLIVISLFGTAHQAGYGTFRQLGISRFEVRPDCQLSRGCTLLCWQGSSCCVSLLVKLIEAACGLYRLLLALQGRSLSLFGLLVEPLYWPSLCSLHTSLQKERHLARLSGLDPQVSFSPNIRSCMSAMTASSSKTLCFLAF